MLIKSWGLLRGITMNREEIEKEIAALSKVATLVPSRNAGRILMKVAALMRELAKLKGE